MKLLVYVHSGLDLAIVHNRWEWFKYHINLKNYIILDPNLYFYINPERNISPNYNLTSSYNFNIVKNFTFFSSGFSPYLSKDPRSSQLSTASTLPSTTMPSRSSSTEGQWRSTFYVNSIFLWFYRVHNLGRKYKNTKTEKGPLLRCS